MLEPVIVKQNTSRSLLAILGSLVFSVFCFCCVVLDFRNAGSLLETLSRTEAGRVFIKVFFGLGGCLFAFAVFYYIKRIIQGKEVLVVNEKGIYDNSSQSSVGFIPWHDIKRVYLEDMLEHTSARQRVIEVEVKDEELYLQKKSKLIQKAMLLNKKNHHQMICISLNFTGVKPETVMPQIQQFFESTQRGEYHG